MRTFGLKRWIAGLISLVLVIGAIPMTASAVEISPPAEENFTLLWTTDPQWYSFAYPEIIDHQNEWVVEYFSRLDMRYILHTGDFVDNPNSTEQWAIMDAAYKKWDDAGLPYGVLAGNHDVSGSDHSNFSRYFGQARYSSNSWYGESYEDNFGHYDLMTIEGVKFMFVYMGYNSTYKDADYAWLNSVLAKHSDHIAILNFHEYLAATGQRTANGDLFFKNVVLKNPNVRMVQCGHNYNSTRKVEEIDDNGDGKADRTVYQVMANFQSTTKGGNGFMRFMECDVADGRIINRTYSPYIGEYGSDYEDGALFDEFGTRDSFTIPFDFSEPTAKQAGDPESGTVVVSSQLSFAPTDTAQTLTLPVVYQNQAETGNVFEGVGVYDRYFSLDAADAFVNPAQLNYVVAKYTQGSGYTVTSVVRGSSLEATEIQLPIPQDSVVIALPSDVDISGISSGRKVMLNKLKGIKTPTAQKDMTVTFPSFSGVYTIDARNRLAGNDEWVVYDSLCEKTYTHEWDMLFAYAPVNGSLYKVTAVNTTLGQAKSLSVPAGGFVLAVNTCSARGPLVTAMRSALTVGSQVLINGFTPGEAQAGTTTSLLAPSISAWTRDSSILAVEQSGDAQVLYNTNSGWPTADYTYPTPLAVDTATMSVTYDYMIQTGAQTNIWLHFKDSTPASPVSGQYVHIHKYFDGAYISPNSGDAKGDDVRRSGKIPLSNVDITADCYNADGTLTLNGISIFVAGSAQMKQYYYDLSITTETSVDESALAQSAPLTGSDITVTNDALWGGYTYDNGDLTVTADTDSGYELTINMNRSFNVSVLKNWLLDVEATAPFDIRLTVTTSAGDAEYGLAPDFWPSLCAQTVKDCIPAGAYENCFDLLSCYTYNGVLPANGITTVKKVTIKLADKGTLFIDALQVSNGTVAGSFGDGVTKTVTTPAYILGDVTGDKQVTTSDARYAILHAIGSVQLEDNAFLAADFNKDGDVTTIDAQQIIRYALTH